ncbi:flagellar rod assembly protein/muramidase FlgJ [Erwinia sp. OLTSP20]|uniref:flagellar assembly peptidoglycan hydrolase FlgJ n=1 Tax=unclassified Erwinia TaxID=2622719 RepID=UPI000C1982A7|nr:MULTISPECIES: flagellar assembly peptidoglycan hydrolase FlgJ [unclassified Erwinia]PIJ51927.1 flagellar rod assembly protein/muramidase FlgJ [Erwinia sp. OAMSP11]PIJ74802.1 flagellar rod assembly protein/muramidase FlgJ [Erwinia sp. OLSSP12]PIJ85188.1 flagellar rod assembly protein/muramidase FlgJ [Erwinia sp. OLCASP19]PIJ87189.1 flagellar rod assembly protein/muramidase FlgJ [Erwinia sp. OLMTSP26]PIJ88333.1 flagellar rod assembly protein/muramidase FlgJ [Erwinia sp. OLMDSP33]
MNDTQSLMNAAYDSRSLNALKRAASADPKAHAREVAKQVEGMFVQMMLKSMRDALPKDGLLSNDQSRLYTSMYDQQIAQQIGEKGLGLADTIVQQMAGPQAPDENAGSVPMALDKRFINTLPPLMMTQMVSRAVPHMPPADATMHADSAQFLARLSQPAQMASRQSGIPHHLILAQAALESGWGQREILTQDGRRSYNIFAIKANASWQGKTTEVMTTEYENGVAHKIKQKFRVYDSYFDALNDYVRLLSSNPRYAAVTTASTPEQAAHALQQAGYATDPQYARKLVGMIQQFRNIGEKVVKAYSGDLTTLF